MPMLISSFQFGPFSLHLKEHLLRQAGREIELRPKAFEVLSYLVTHYPQLVKKEELLEAVWPETEVSETVLTHCITEVRQALGDESSHPRFLKTITRVGYKFIGEVLETCEEAAPSAPPKPFALVNSIAVLPFANLSADPENEFFCDGLSEELINRLTSLRQLRVVAHSSSFAFKNQNQDISEIGRKLGVQTILEGSVRKSGNRLRISAQLIDARDGFHLWAQQYEREVEDIFHLQDEISLAVVEKLKVSLSIEEEKGFRAHSSCDLRAYHLYLAGNYFWHRRWQGSFQKAMERFQQAVTLDPQYAPAYAGLANCYTALGSWGFLPPGEAFPAATRLVGEALRLDSSLGEAYATKAFIRTFYNWDWSGAEAGFRQAMQLNPGNSLIHHYYAHFLAVVGRFPEAFEEMHQAQNLDPLQPLVHANLGFIFYLAHQFDRTVEELNAALELDPQCATAYFYRGILQGRLGRHSEAIASLQRSKAILGEMPTANELIGANYAQSGRREKALEILREAEIQSQSRYIPSSAFALIYLGLGDDAQVYSWLERAYDERDVLIPWIKGLPEFDHLHADPRFHHLLQRTGLA
jgi:TolB-like protein/Flp pilus assembly protein TadD